MRVLAAWTDLTVANASLSEDRRERSLEVAQIGLHRGSWAGFELVTGLEVGLLLFPLHWTLALDRLFRIRDVLRELLKRFVVADSWGMRRLEGPVMLDWGRTGLARLASRNFDVFANDRLVRVEEMSLFNLLRERFILHQSFAFESFNLG